MVNLQDPLTPAYNHRPYELGNSSHADLQVMFFTSRKDHYRHAPHMHIPKSRPLPWINPGQQLSITQPLTVNSRFSSKHLSQAQ